MTNLKGKKTRAPENEKPAAGLGITVEELADRNVPTVGFDENGERHFDYGTRRFAVTLCAIAPDVEIEVFQLTTQEAKAGKKTKNLPKPGTQDDLSRAEAAQEEFKQMKK